MRTAQVDDRNYNVQTGERIRSGAKKVGRLLLGVDREEKKFVVSVSRILNLFETEVWELIPSFPQNVLAWFRLYIKTRERHEFMWSNFGAVTDLATGNQRLEIIL